MVPTLTYGAQTWSMSKAKLKRLMVTYFRMLRSIIKIRIKDKAKLSEVSEITGIKEIGGK